MTWWQSLLLALLLLSQGLYLFYDARKKGRYAWLWGIAGLIQFPLPLLAYLIYHNKLKEKH